MKHNYFLRQLYYVNVSLTNTFAAWYVRLGNAGRVAHYLTTHPIKKLHLGAGGNLLPGWCNTDIVPDLKTGVYLNITRHFPFASGSFEYVFSEHTIEHISLRQGIAMLQECFRVLKPKGRVRIATPDLKFLIEMYNQEKTDLQKREITRIVDMVFPDVNLYYDSFVINNFFRNWGHQFIYDYKVLKALLERVGFTQVTLCQVAESADENLRGLEAHGKFISPESNKLQTFVVEAVKP